MAITPKDIIYFVITDRFYCKPGNSENNYVDKNNPYYFHGGTIDGIIEKIPYLKKLGITAVWITPVYLQIPLIVREKDKETVYCGYHGYWPLDFNSIDPHFYIDTGKYEKGSKKYLKDFVDKMHENGIKVILDMIVNHTGYNHPALTGNPNNPTPIQPHWFNSPSINISENIVEGSLAGLPDLDLDNIDVINYHIDTIMSWIEETGIDAIRMDTVKHVEKKFWQAYKTTIKGKYPQVTLLGEVLEFDIDKIAEYQKKFDFDNLFDFPLQQKIKEVFIHGHSMKEIVSPFNDGSGLLEKDDVYNNPIQLVTLLDNHDLSARFMTWAIKEVGGHEKKNFAVWIMKLSLTFLFTIRGIPQIYYGTEYGMEGEADPDNRRDFNWNIFDENYSIKKRYAYEEDVFNHICKLIKIRKENEVLSIGNFVTLYVDDFILIYLKYLKNSFAIVILHNGWLPMNDYLKVNIAQNTNIPTYLREKLYNIELTCAITGDKIKIVNGEFWVKLLQKSSMVLLP